VTRYLAFDTETEATRQGCKLPPMACLTWQAQGDEHPSIVHWSEAKPIFMSWLRDPEVIIVGHFVAYDMGVCAAAWPDLIPEIFDAYERDRVTCTMLREKLWDIALGHYRGFPDEKGVWHKNSYDLDQVARRRAGMPLKKDGWRKRYGEFRHLPIKDWPVHAASLAEEARIQVAAGVTDKDLAAVANGDPNEVVLYPLNDARATLAVLLSQEETRRDCDPDPFADEFRRARDSWWENLMSAWGMRTHGPGVEQLKKQTDSMIAALEGDLIKAGLVRPDGSRDTKKAVARMLEVCGWRQIVELDADGKKKFRYEHVREDVKPLRKTKSGDVSLDRDACKESDDDLLIDYGDLAQQKAVRDKDVPMLAAGVHLPVHTRIDLAASGRTTSSGPNIRNLRRLPGIREAFIPREGWVFAQADYPGLELRTLAQACFDLFGYSALGDMLNRGEDPHLAFAVQLIGDITYAEAKKALKDSSHPRHKEVEAARQIGKVFNFGSPGGLGAEKLLTFARKTYNVVFAPTHEESIEKAKQWKKVWLATLPEMRDLFNYVGRLCDNPKKEATILQLRSHRIRGGCTYTAGCNTWFQGLGADATQDAGFAIAKGCYVDRSSPLFGSRIANYVYDEFILETPDTDAAHDVAHELARVMRVKANEWLPNVPFQDGQIEPLLMRVWSKEAEPIEHYETGRLVPWHPVLASFVKLGKAVNDFVASRPNLRVAA
jgi:DNA polymerase I